MSGFIDAEFSAGGGLRCGQRFDPGDINGDTVADFEIKMNLGTR